MPVTPTYPGVYIEEIPSGVRTIVGVATSITAFIGRALRGPVNEPIRIQNFGDFERQFGGLWIDSTMSYAVQHYFLNGGTDAIIVRLVNAATKASFSLAPTSGSINLRLEASSEGEWGNNLRIAIDHNSSDPATVFNLIVTEIDPTTSQLRQQETFRNVSIAPTASRYLGKVLAQESRLLRVPDPYLGAFPTVDPEDVPQDLSASPPNFGTSPSVSGSDGNALTFTEYEGSRSNKTGIYVLEKADLFNLLCIPPFTRDSDVAQSTWDAAVKYCEDRRALLIVDPPSNWKEVANVTDSRTGVDRLNLRKKNAAIYFPRLKMADPLQENRLEEFVPCGVVAGIYARTDANRGVWKAPAGIEATLTGVRELSVKLTDGENGQLNPLGVNCLRNFPVIGNVVWGARTLEGADRLASEWKYVPVRRMALFIEESLYRGTQWVVFEPNDEPLWAQIRLNVGAFMQNLFRQGAFQGKSPREAYLVKCDKETTTQNDINLGIVNIVVGFAPLKPAEFVIIKIQQLAGQIAT
jgi:phage tail sheath protein FI